jgi:hypothetical protein
MVISQLEITMDSTRSLHPMAKAWLLLISDEAQQAHAVSY